MSLGLVAVPATHAGPSVHSPTGPAALAAGVHDAHITDWATRLADCGSPVMLRFGREMNGNWYPWAEGVNGNGAGDCVTAWRHVHDIFTRAGAGNVRWVWNPSVSYDGSTPLDGLYPGKEIVLAETASAEAGGSKVERNAHLVYYLAQQPDVTGLVWFHLDTEAD